MYRLLTFATILFSMHQARALNCDSVYEKFTSDQWIRIYEDPRFEWVVEKLEDHIREQLNPRVAEEVIDFIIHEGRVEASISAGEIQDIRFVSAMRTLPLRAELYVINRIVSGIFNLNPSIKDVETLGYIDFAK